MEKGIRIVNREGKRVVEGIGYYEPAKISDLKQIVKDSAKKYGDAKAFLFKDKQGNITEKTFHDFDRDIDALGTVLHDMGLKGLRFSIIGENRYEWGICYLAVANGTGIAVPLDKHLPENEVEALIERGRVDVIFYSPAYQKMIESISNKNKQLKYYVCMENPEKKAKQNFLSLPELIHKGKTLLDAGNRTFVDQQIDRNAMSILLFTSGTTSMAKGVMLSHSNIASNVSAITSMIKVTPEDTHLSLLPLHHTFENTVGFLFMVHAGAKIAYCDGIKYIAQNLREYNVSLLVAVPAVIETFYKRLMDGIRKSGKEKLVGTMIKVSNALRKIDIDLRRKLFKSIFEQFAPNLRLAVSGAAPLDPEVVVWFKSIGFNVLQGYGLTETSPVVAANNDFVNEPGTIGHPLQGVETAILDPDESGIGEIITRGPNVMLGYYEDEASTTEVLDDAGWFRTGDLGTIDEEGFIRITGRAKSMIVFTNGKKAFPEEYELLLNNIPGVKDSFAWGNTAPDGDIEVCAKLVLDKEVLGNTADEQISGKLNSAIREINKTLPQYKIIRYFIFTDTDLVKTTTLKTKRNIEMEKVMASVIKSGKDMRKLSGSRVE
ncbi:MAG: AMP-binding protein [Thermoclostridium sp.]|nr:AMP-binding protein [Thermoclostridium sp.]